MWGIIDSKYKLVDWCEFNLILILKYIDNIG